MVKKCVYEHIFINQSIWSQVKVSSNISFPSERFLKTQKSLFHSILGWILSWNLKAEK